jgi:protein-S-isoprenylcysteine O-methyltransferase Ste14
MSSLKGVRKAITKKNHDLNVRMGDTVLQEKVVATETKTEKPRTRTLWSSVISPLTLLAFVFTVALTFATIELPRILAILFIRAGWIPDVNPGMQPEIVEGFMKIARPIGFACLAAVMGLIIMGFITKRRKLSSLGALIFFLPTFGYFAGSMFFLAGLGILRITWIPFWEFNLVNLGDIAYLPYMTLVYPFSLVGLDLRMPLALVATGLGFFIFLLGTIAWFYGKAEKRETVTFWIYKYTRHPQYLGYIIWSYGVMLQASLTGISWGGSNPGASLPWLISTLIVVCIALSEEINMSKRDAVAYLKYKESAPFMFPAPKFVSSLATAPIKILFDKKQPENRKEIIGTFLVYCLIFIALSLPFVFLNWPLDHQWWKWPLIPISPGPSPGPSPAPGTR